MKEEWRPVVGYEEEYEVSSFGRVRSLPRTIKHYTGSTFERNGKILKLTEGGRYNQVHLCKNGVGKTHIVHRLVAAAFIGPKLPGQHVRHLDGNARNNDPKNLAYGSAIENVNDMLRHGTQAKGVWHGQSKLKPSDVLKIRALRGLLTHKEIAAKFGISVSQVGNIIYCKQWAHVKG